MQTGGQMHLVAYGNYDANEKVIHFPHIEGIDTLKNFNWVGYDALLRIRIDTAEKKTNLVQSSEVLAKVERVNADEDGVSLKLTTEGITKGAYAKKKVKESLYRVKSGEYSVGIGMIQIQAFEYADILFNEGSFSPIISALAVELEVKGSKLKMKPMEERILKYDAKEDKVGSVASEKVMAEIGKKLEEDEDVNSVRLLVKMKDGNELTLSIISLEKHDGMVWGNIKGSKKTLDYLKSEIGNVYKAALLSTRTGTRTDWPGFHYLLLR